MPPRITPEAIERARSRHRERMAKQADRTEERARNERDQERRRKLFGQAYKLRELIEYEPVEVRVLEFRRDHPLGTIETEPLHNSGGNIMAFRAKVVVYTDDDGPCLLATAHKPVGNSTRGNALEMAETQAVGRALMLAGYGVLHDESSVEAANTYLEYETAIDSCTDQEELGDVSRAIQEAARHMDAADIAKLRAAWKAKRDELAAAEEATE